MFISRSILFTPSHTWLLITLEFSNKSLCLKCKKVRTLSVTISNNESTIKDLTFIFVNVNQDKYLYLVMLNA